ncbi:MAG: hypothetical protein DWI22_21545 [Planctomycetota bacterium]|nr:MAG: hypothetical protein DWI22_21545 [Planctomycetota bacterium]
MKKLVQELCQSCLNVCHWLCQCFLQLGSTGIASGAQSINECVTVHWQTVDSVVGCVKRNTTYHFLEHVKNRCAPLALHTPYLNDQTLFETYRHG